MNGREFRCWHWAVMATMVAFVLMSGVLSAQIMELPPEIDGQGEEAVRRELERQGELLHRERQHAAMTRALARQDRESAAAIAREALLQRRIDEQSQRESLHREQATLRQAESRRNWTLALLIVGGLAGVAWLMRVISPAQNGRGGETADIGTLREAGIPDEYLPGAAGITGLNFEKAPADQLPAAWREKLGEPRPCRTTGAVALFRGLDAPEKPEERLRGLVPDEFLPDPVPAPAPLAMKVPTRAVPVVEAPSLDDVPRGFDDVKAPAPFTFTPPAPAFASRITDTSIPDEFLPEAAEPPRPLAMYVPAKQTAAIAAIEVSEAEASIDEWDIPSELRPDARDSEGRSSMPQPASPQPAPTPSNPAIPEEFLPTPAAAPAPLAMHVPGQAVRTSRMAAFPGGEGAGSLESSIPDEFLPEAVKPLAPATMRVVRKAEKVAPPKPEPVYRPTPERSDAVAAKIAQAVEVAARRAEVDAMRDIPDEFLPAAEDSPEPFTPARRG